MAGAEAGEEGLAEAVLVAGDHGVGGGEDVPGRAEVLFEPHLRGVREIPSEPSDQRNVRAAPAIDRLIVVADREDAPAKARDGLEPMVLGVVDVLVLVGEDRV